MSIARAFSVYKRAAFLALVFCAPLLSAQSFLKAPNVDIFAGYSLLRFDSVPFGFPNRLNLSGANVELALPDVIRGWGIVADVSGHYSNELEAYNFLIGPQYTFQVKGINIFGRGMGGKARERLRQVGTSTFEPSTLGGAFALGGGVDIPFGDRFSLRPIQADYLIASAFGEKRYSPRFSAGFVIHFGKKRNQTPSF
jgi:hypothetical protein